jgi:hypothetical protein
MYYIYPFWLMCRNMGCHYEYLLQSKIISLFLILAIVDLIAFLAFNSYCLLIFTFIVKYFLKRTKTIFRTLGISPYLFNCLNAQNFDAKIYGNNLTCIICCEEINDNEKVIVLKCHTSHIYHSKCIVGWLHKKFFCPICKSYNIV